MRLRHQLGLGAPRQLSQSASVRSCSFIMSRASRARGCERKRAGGQVRSPGETFLNRNQACGCLSELAYISQAKPETKGQESEGGSRYLVSLQPQGRKRGKWGVCCPELVDGGRRWGPEMTTPPWNVPCRC